MKKIAVLFVCLGNICRSPAAEAIFLDLIKKEKISHRFIVDSAGTGSWHVGKKSDSRMRIAAQKRELNILSRARQVDPTDFEKFNYILTMDNSNFNNILKIKSKTSASNFSQIKKIQEFSSVFNDIEVPDPYFGGEDGFDHVLDILADSVKGFLDSLDLK